ncbi:hypothetical protein H1S01_03355 [Heliobacterium chlorum]|uniref:Uncharacterized protein n=1 Tax=Heliobacterium chlorum TaxID=2698 RepID=A0ABR7T133_HELCL|nr:hypothetical protein [Heliobacterium chlorum]MBC9783549.1 hypothetical protein [Heliobacterium chlorum]
MAELTEDMIRNRLNQIQSGIYEPEINGLPDLVLHKITLQAKGKASQAYSSKLKELMAQGGMFNEAFLPRVLEKACKDAGIDLKAPTKQRKALERFFKEAPHDLLGPIDQLTDEEASLLPEELQKERQKAIEERTQRLSEFMETFHNEDELRAIEETKMIEDLERQLRAQTYEHRAREYQLLTEIFESAKTKEGKPYFSLVEQIAELDLTNQEALIQLFFRWRLFKEGRLPEFFRANYPAKS